MRRISSVWVAVIPMVWLWVRRLVVIQLLLLLLMMDYCCRRFDYSHLWAGFVLLQRSLLMWD